MQQWQLTGNRTSTDDRLKFAGEATTTVVANDWSIRAMIGCASHMISVSEIFIGARDWDCLSAVSCHDYETSALLKQKIGGKTGMNKNCLTQN